MVKATCYIKNNHCDCGLAIITSEWRRRALLRKIVCSDPPVAGRTVRFTCEGRDNETTHAGQTYFTCSFEEVKIASQKSEAAQWKPATLGKKN
jgi:hypothetical protein